MRVLVVGRGGREHALVQALHASGCTVLATRPNPGMASHAAALDIDPLDIPGVLNAATTARVDLVVVGPEAPLVAGLADVLRARGIATFGPGKHGAHLEGSKAATKDFLVRHGIPTAQHWTCTSTAEALAIVRRHGAPIVVKADGLAAGKGVVVATTLAQAEAAILEFMEERSLGDAGATVVIEECLEGLELSAMALLDGTRFLALDPCRDHKRLRDGDAGPNTGGMGAVCPVPLPRELQVRIQTTVLAASLAGLQRDGIDYRGVLYAGVMLTRDGPKVLEYNVRFGDPEAQVLLPRMGASFAQWALAAAQGRLDAIDSADPTPAPAAVTVVLAAAGYPQAPRTGDVITGVDAAETLPDVRVFHAATVRADDGTLRTAGGRVLSVTGLGADVRAARDAAYRGVDRIAFAGMQLRRDIAASVLTPG